MFSRAEVAAASRSSCVEQRDPRTRRRLLIRSPPQHITKGYLHPNFVLPNSEIKYCPFVYQ